MPHAFDQILPSLQAAGLWAYWIIALIVMFEAIVLTGVVSPGGTAAIAGGILVQQRVLGYFDLVWFVAIATFIGSEASYRLGRIGARGLSRSRQLSASGYVERARELLIRYGGFAMVIGRFLGPVSAFVPFSAAMAGMTHRRFLLWNIASSLPYALTMPALGYFFGSALHTVGPVIARIVLFGLAALVVLAVLWFLFARVERTLPFLISLVRSIFRAVAENPFVSRWSARHPRLASFVAHRLDTSRFSGLTATLLAAAFFYLFTVYVGTVLDFVMADPVVQADTRLANLLYAFRDPRLIRVFTYVTALGDWKTVLALLIGASAALLLARRPHHLWGLWVAVLGNQLSVTLLKALFHRPRPELAYYHEISGSFPSGHAAISVAFFGMLFFLAWRESLVPAMLAGLAAVTLGFLIGLSRIYLIEHYLSDVLNGYLVGGLWLVIGISVAEWRLERAAEPGALSAPPRATRWAVVGVLVISLVIAGGLVSRYSKPRNAPPPRPAATQVADIPALFSSKRAPAFTETITGSPQTPISLVIVARDSASLKVAMAKAGWVGAEPPDISSLTRAVWAVWTNRGDSSAPVTPYFWRGAPNDFAFQKRTSAQTLHKRHHARFWVSGFTTPSGAQVFVGSASFDDGMKWGLTHHIAPDIDAERRLVVKDLRATGLVASMQSFQMVPTMLGQNFTGDSFFTDGKAILLTLGAQKRP